MRYGIGGFKFRIFWWGRDAVDEPASTEDVDCDLDGCHLRRPFVLAVLFGPLDRSLWQYVGKPFARGWGIAEVCVLVVVPVVKATPGLTAPGNGVVLLQELEGEVDLCGATPRDFAHEQGGRLVRIVKVTRAQGEGIGDFLIVVDAKKKLPVVMVKGGTGGGLEGEIGAVLHPLLERHVAALQPRQPANGHKAVPVPVGILGIGEHCRKQPMEAHQNGS